MNATVTVKRCSQCGEEKPLTAFGRDARHRDGLQSHCRSCDSDRSSRYFADHRAAVEARLAIYRASHRDDLSERQGRYYRDHHEERVAYNNDYYFRTSGPRVYVCYGTTGTIIYVGRTNSRHRLAIHKRDSKWWPQVAKVRTRRCATFADALVLEALLIRRHLPIFNIDGVSR